MRLSVWEKLMIKAISDAYATERSVATEKDREAPYCSLPLEVDRDAVTTSVKNVMANLMSRQSRPQHTAI